MNKRAQGLSLTTIVVAAVVLVVLVILVGIFTGYFSDFVPTLVAGGQQTCSADGFNKRLTSGGCADDETRVYGNFGKNLRDDQICCKEKRDPTLSEDDPPQKAN